MQEHTANPPQYKTCIRGEKCIHPDGPTLPLTEFYKQRGMRDGLCSLCKECKKAYGAARYRQAPRQQWREKSGHPSEQMTIDRLRAVGIYAAPGKSSEYRWIDVVAWGCVRIEVKSSSMDHSGKYQFNMGMKRKKERERSDLVVLIMLDNPPRFFVLKSTHPVFYHEDGRPKSGVSYATGGNPPKSRRGVVLNAELLSAAEDRWELVEQRRLEIVQEVQATGTVTLVKQGGPEQLTFLE